MKVFNLVKAAVDTANEQEKTSGKVDPEKNEALQQLRIVIANLVNRRFFNGKEIPAEVINAARVQMSGPQEILIPFKASKGM